MRVITMALPLLAVLATPALAADPEAQGRPLPPVLSEPSLSFEPPITITTPLTRWFAEDRSLSRAFRSNTIRREAGARRRYPESAMRANAFEAQRGCRWLRNAC